MKTSEEPNINLYSQNQVFNGRKILVVDDVKINFMLIKAMLNKTGARVHWAEDGFKALSLLADDPKYDIILMDYNMPEMDGLETTIRIKKMLPTLPVVSQSTFTDSPHFDRSNAPFDAYLPKPIVPESLIYELNKFI